LVSFNQFTILIHLAVTNTKSSEQLTALLNNMLKS